MRGDQLAALIKPHLSDDLHIRVVPFHAGLLSPLAMRTVALSVPAKSVVVFVKSAAKGLTSDHIAPLRQRGARIGLDSIDTTTTTLGLRWPAVQRTGPSAAATSATCRTRSSRPASRTRWSAST
ncbi:hypothetical protein [Maritimibacter sp. 55A14]|uniref:hypothetical protein n=1 Tax=Maritimibacter sp. 55A14 TaxID=2174844 RepID=UPI0035175FEE